MCIHITNSQICIIKTAYLPFNCFRSGRSETDSILERRFSNLSCDCAFAYFACASICCTVAVFGVCFAHCLLFCSMPRFCGLLISSLAVLSFIGGLSNSSQLNEEISLIEGSRQCRFRLETTDGVLHSRGRLQDISCSSTLLNETSRNTASECLCAPL